MKYIKILTFGLLSAIISWQSWRNTHTSVPLWLPGLIFGFVLIFILNKEYKIAGAFWKKILLLAISTLAYFIAVYIVFHNLAPSSQFKIFFLAGLVGAFLLNFGMLLLYKLFDLKRVIFLSVLGGCLGLSFLIGGNQEKVGLFWLFIIWQVGMLFAMKILSNNRNV